jgi:competence protein ComEC
MRVALIGFALGVLALQGCAELPAMPTWLTASGAALLLAAAQAVSRSVRFRGALIVLAAAGAFAAGFGYAAMRAQARLADVLPPEWEGRDIALVGVIDDLPQPVERGVRFPFAVERIVTDGAVVPSSLSLAWYAGFGRGDAAREVPALHAGERWQFTVRLKRPHGTVNPHGFDVEAWLLENDLRATGYVRAGDANLRLDAFAARPGDWIARERERIRDRILSALEGKPYAGVIAALAIGDERAIPESQWQLFNRTGIGHLISISGLHVTFFATLIGGVVFALWKRRQALTTRLPARKAAALAGVAAALIYVLLAGFQIPAQRTLYMLAVAACGLWLGRPGTASVVWLWALVVVLAIDPWAGLTPGFWLSFGAVGLLLYVGCGRVDVTSAWREATRAQVAITLGLIPLTLALFQQISLVSPLANAVAIPVVTFGVVPLALAAIVLPWSALLLLAHAVFAAVAVWLEWLAALPSAVWQQHAPQLWAVICGVIGVLWLLAPRGVPGRVLGLIWLLPLFVIAPELPAPGAFRMIVIDVGQGLAVLVQTHGHALLYDTGPRYTQSSDAGNRIVAPMLRSLGVARLDTLVVSHQDTDHSGGALSVLATVPTGEVLSSLPADHPIVRQREARGERVRRCLAGERWQWDGVELEWTHPVAANYDNPKLKSNDLSCVLRVSSAHGSALITGDIEARTEADLVRRTGAQLRSDVLIVPHHGSKTSSTPAFIGEVAPKVAVYAAGYRNRFDHPRAEIVERYARAGAAAYRTDYDGALTFDFAAKGAPVPRRERAYDAHYWRERSVPGAAALSE